MSDFDTSKPHISIERGANDTYAIWLKVAEGGQPAGVRIERTPENAHIIDYFYERLKRGMNV